MSLAEAGWAGYRSYGSSRCGPDRWCLPALDSAAQPQIQPVRGVSALLGQWEMLSGEVAVPAGVGAMTVLVWAPRDGTGTCWVDNVAVEATLPDAA